MAGGIVVQTNPLYTPRELKYPLKDSGATFIVCLDIMLPRVQKVQGETELEHIIVAEIKDYLPFPKNLIYPFIQRREYGISVKVEDTDTVHRSEEHTSELQSRGHLVCRLLLEKKKLKQT